MNPNPFDSAELYTCDPEEDASETDPDEAVRGYLSGLYEGEYPATVMVYAYNRKTIDPRDKESWSETVLESLLEAMDLDGEGYGHPEEATEPTAEMRAAAERFVAEIVGLYTVRSVEEAAFREVEVLPWIREHEPHWLATEPSRDGAGK